MFTTLRSNKVSALLVVVTAIALVFARDKTIEYVQAHTYARGKGARDGSPELWAYGFALLMALTEFAFLSARAFLFRVLFLAAALANVLYFTFLVFVFLYFGTREPASAATSRHDYLFEFPFLCDVVFAVLFFLKRERSINKASGPITRNPSGPKP